MNTMDELATPLSLTNIAPSQDEEDEAWTNDKWIKNVMEDPTILSALQGLQQSVQAFENRASEAEIREMLQSKSAFDTVLRAAQKLHADSHDKTDANNSFCRRAWIKVKGSYSRFADISFELSKHLDALLLAAPSYVRAAWGAIHLLLLMQINDQKMKDATTDMLGLISQKFELLETFTAYHPNKKMVSSLVAVYAAYIQLLQHAVRFYAENHIKRVAKSIFNRWEVQFRPYVDRVDKAIEIVLQAGQVSASGTMQQMHWEFKSLKTQLGDIATLLNVSLLENRHQHQSMMILKQRLLERSFSFCEAPIRPQDEEAEKEAQPGSHQESSTDAQPAQKSFLEHLNYLQDALFPDLARVEKLLQARQTLHQPRLYLTGPQKDDSPHRNAEYIIEWLSLSHSALLWVDRDDSIHQALWDLSFLEPLVSDFVAHHERCLVLKYFCRGLGVPRRYNTATVILQSFVFSTLRQYKDSFLASTQAFERHTFEEAAENLDASWQLLNQCLEIARPSYLLLVVDAVDYLNACVGDSVKDTADSAYLTKCFGELLNLPDCIVKVLLTADNAPQPSSPGLDGKQGKMVLYGPPSISSPSSEPEITPASNSLVLSMSMGKPLAVHFSEVWMLYPAGSVAFTQTDGQYRAFTIGNFHYQPGSTSIPLRVDTLIINCWATGYSDKRLVRISKEFTISSFSGAVSVDTLQLTPSAYVMAEADVRSKLVERGKRFAELSKCFHHLQLRRPENDLQTSARVIVDFAAPRKGSDLGLLNGDFPDPTASTQRTDPGLKYKPIIYLTCPAFVPAYDLDFNEWTTAAVDDLDAVPRYGKGILNNINLDSNDCEVIYDVASMYSQGFGAFHNARDPVDGHPTTRQKEGRVCLFHGPPGSGKSYAVKTVADVLRIPVVRILGSTIHENQRPGETLRRLFNYAAAWGAFILMERIDQYLAPQNLRDDVEYITIPSLIRQELMATTAPVFIVAVDGGHLDPSFRTLVSLAVEFKPWLAERRFDLLEALFRTAGLTKESPEWSEISEWIREDVASYENLDGRQLKNLVSVSIAIAKANEQPLRRREIKIVAKGLERLNKGR